MLSGWARVPGTRSEAELMAAAWEGRARELVVDPDARTTVGNAANALDDIRRVGAREVVVVTSRWHAARAKAAFRLAAARKRRPRQRRVPAGVARTRARRCASCAAAGALAARLQLGEPSTERVVGRSRFRRASAAQR